MAASNIPVIVQGNSFSLAIPLQIYVIENDEMVLQDYYPDPTDVISIQLKGDRRQYTYTPTVDGNICNIDLSGNELADNYSVVVSIVKADGQRLRSFRTDQFFIVESSDDLTPADIIEGLEENVIYLNSSIFVAGADGRGVTSIEKTATVGLVDTYTITYTDNTTSTYQVTNGADGAQGVGITSIEKTSTSGLVDTYTITLSNGSTSAFEVTNGRDGHDLGLAVIVDDLTTGGHEDALSAEQGKVLGDEVFGEQEIVSTNMPISQIDGYCSLTTNIANNLTTSDPVVGINIKVRQATTLTINLYNVSQKVVVREVMAATAYAAGTHSIDFTTPVELGENELISVTVSSGNTLRLNNTDGVGYYANGTLVAGQEVSFNIKTLSKGLQTKVSDIETKTAIVPTLKDDVIGKEADIIPIGKDIKSFASATNVTKYYANRLITDKKILGVRLYCLKAATDSVSIGLFDYNTISVTDLKTSVSVVKGLNTILFDAPIYLKPNQLVAVKSSTTYVIGLVSNVDGVVGMYPCDAHNYMPKYVQSYELIVEDDGLMGDVAELEMIPTRKSWCSVGTSITHANGGNDILMGYQDRVMQKISFSDFTNVGVAGQAIATGAKSGPVPCLAAQVDTVLTTVADLYTIEHGINDWNRCATIGTIDDFINNTGYSTFYGAWRIVIDKIYTLNPNAKIILITPRKAYGAGVFPDHWWEANTAGGNDYYLKDYVAAVKAIGEFLSLPVCDWFADSNTNQYNLAADSIDVALHPNDTGYQKLANLLVQTFKKVID